MTYTGGALIGNKTGTAGMIITGLQYATILFALVTILMSDNNTWYVILYGFMVTFYFAASELSATSIFGKPYGVEKRDGNGNLIE